MTRRKETGRTLFLSIISLVLSVSMLVGTTMAWFTDSVTSGVNLIQAGNLDVSLEYYDAETEKFLEVKGDTRLLGVDALWEPGYTEVVYLKIANEGSLNLKYQLSANVIGETAGVSVNGDTILLSEHLVFKVVKLDSIDDVGTYSRETAQQVAGAIRGLNDYNGPTMSLEPKRANEVTHSEDYIALILYMPEIVGNEANYAKDSDIPEIKLGISLFATQVEAELESDSFGPNYDQGAPIVKSPIDRPTTAVTLLGPGDNEVALTLPKSVVDSLPAEVTQISLAISTPIVDTTNNSISFDSIELVDQNGNVIDLEALNLKENVTVTLPAQTQFAAGEMVAAYHDGEIVATSVVDANGVVSYSVGHLCQVTIASLEKVTEKPGASEGEVVTNYEIGTVGQLLAFAAEVNSGNSYAGKTVVLTNNINLNNISWTPIGNWDNAFAGTFDGQGYTISNLYINDVDGEGVGLFGVAENATFKNVNIKNVNVTGYSMVASLVGSPYSGCTISNCHVSGNIKLTADYAYVGGIAAYGYTSLSDCSVIAEGTGMLTSKTRNAVGGIMAWMLEGKNSITNCTVKNLELTGWANLGSITGFVHYSNVIDGCSVENVVLTKTRMDGHPTVGMIAGGWSYNGSNAITISNNTVKNVTMNGNYVAVSSANELYGAEYGGALNSNFVLENNTTENITNNMVEVLAAKDNAQLAEAVNNAGAKVVIAKAGNYTMPKSFAEGVTLICAEGVTFAGTTGLNINGAKVIGATFSNEGGQAVSGTINGTFAECTFNGAETLRWCYTQEGTEVVFDNCVINTTLRGIHFDEMNGNVIFRNCEINGFNAYSGKGTMTFENCQFGNDKSSYNGLNIYTNTNLVNCSFAYVSDNTNFIDMEGTGKTLSISNCTATLDGKEIDVAQMVGGSKLAQNTLIIDGTTSAKDPVTLDSALSSGQTIAMAGNMSFSANDTTANSGYGPTGLKVAGGILDGNGYTVDVKNAGSTWGCAINTTGGTIKNVTVSGAMRGIFMGGASADVYIDNVTFENVVYTFNSDAGNKDYGVYISNSTLNGWTSFANAHKEVVFTNCSFGEGSGYKFCRPYNATKFIGCDFAEGFKIDARATITFENCTINGVALTAENVATLVTSNTQNATVK